MIEMKITGRWSGSVRRSRMTLNYFSLRKQWSTRHGKKTVLLLLEPVVRFSDPCARLTIPSKAGRRGQWNASLTSSVIMGISVSATAIMLACSARRDWPSRRGARPGIGRLYVVTPAPGYITSCNTQIRRRQTTTMIERDLLTEILRVHVFLLTADIAVLFHVNKLLH